MRAIGDQSPGRQSVLAEAAAKGEGPWAERLQNLVRRLNVPLERGVAALLETGGHGGLAYSLVELGFGRVAVPEIEVQNVFTNLL